MDIKKIKIIDLLNKIAKGEEVPKKFKYEDMVYIYNDDLREHFDEKEGYSFNSTFDLTNTRLLNDEVEIIEDKKIEKLSDELTYIKLVDDKTFRINIVHKINNIIDRLNGEYNEENTNTNR